MAKTTKDSKSKAKKKAEPKKPDERNIKTTHETRQLPCILTTEEQAVAAKKLAKSYSALRSLQAQKSATTADFNAKIKQAEADIDVHAGHVQEGVEVRAVPCDLILNFDTMRAQCLRTDTFEEIEERALNHDEKQMTMPFAGEDTPGNAAVVRSELMEKYGIDAVNKANDNLVEDNSLYRRLSRSKMTDDNEWKLVQMLAEYLRDENAASA